jgi:hypothetical protein
MGQVLSLGPDNTLTIVFENAGKKTLSLEFAKLQRISKNDNHSPALDQLISAELSKSNGYDCEICGAPAESQVGLSYTCSRCNVIVESCKHKEVEVSTSIEDNYLITINCCLECGVRFHPD